MTERDDSRLSEPTLRALREGDDLLPTTEAEVERAEALLSGDVSLPPGLRHYRTREPAKRSNGLLAALGGAAAAAAALTWARPPAPLSVTSAGGELRRASAAAPPKPAPVVLTLHDSCDEACCAGSDCKTPGPGLNACPSGIRCASCAADNVNGGAYRLRLGAMIPTEAGQKLLPLTAPLELCVPAAGREASCVPALGEESGAVWRQLPVVTSLPELLSGLTLELRKRGDATPLASWKHAVWPTAELLCKGLAVPLGDGTDTLGRLSIFVEPTHFVELARAADVPTLLEIARGVDVSGPQLRFFESSQAGAAHFALGIGPLDKTEAEALRWQALSGGMSAQIGLGLDYTGSAHPAK
jgi:hypothetical protein